MNHADLAEAFLSESEEVALPLLNGRRLPANTVGVVPDRPHHNRQDCQRRQRELPAHPHHHAERRNKCDRRRENSCKSLVVNRLNALRVVGHPEAGIRAPPGVVKLERETLHRAV